MRKKTLPSPSLRQTPMQMQDAGVDEVARWLVDSARLPQYEQAFRDNDVYGPMLQDIVENAMLGELIENLPCSR